MLASIRLWFSTPSFCIIGAGPAGLYTARHLYREVVPCPRVVLLEQYPCPFGLLRYGVAPDHATIKNASNTLRKVLDDQHAQFYGNVQVGTHVSFDQLAQHFSGVVYCQGGNIQQTLQLEGQAAVLSARELVGWYNSEPGYDVPPALSSVKDLVIVGNGNVAIDISRLLAKGSGLRGTDIRLSALEMFGKHSIRRIHVIGRRGLIQSAFSLKELRELCGLANVQVCLFKQDVKDSSNPTSLQQLDDIGAFHLSRLNRRKTEFLQQTATILQSTDIPESNCLQIILHYLSTPVSLKGSTLALQRNRLVGPKHGQRAEQAEGVREIACDLLINSTGYRPAGEYRHECGVVLNGDKLAMGRYVGGWAKTACKGVLDATLLSCEQTVNNIRMHTPHLPTPDPTPLLHSLQNTVSYSQYQQLEQHEQQKGKEQGKPILKVTSVKEMLSVMGV